MGRHTGSGPADELPIHTVNLDGFWMDKFETTNELYATYLNEAYAAVEITVINGQTFTVLTDKEIHPVGEVSWYGVCMFANWRRISGLLKELVGALHEEILRTSSARRYGFHQAKINHARHLPAT